MGWRLMLDQMLSQDRQLAKASRVLCLYWMHLGPLDSGNSEAAARPPLRMPLGIAFVPGLSVQG